MSKQYDLRTVADGAADAWDTAPKSHKPILRDCSDALMQAADEIDRLQAIVDRLPKTADGVPIVPGDVLHFMDVSMQTVLCWQLPENPRGDEIAVANCCPFSGTYSTREAAEKARKP